MSEPGGGWTTPEGWGAPPPQSAPPGPPPPSAPGGHRSEWGGQDPSGPQPPPWGARPVELKPGIVPLRPLGLGEVLDGAVSVLRRYPRPALGLAALVAVVTTALNIVLLVTTLRPLLEIDAAAMNAGSTDALADALAGAAAFASLSGLLSVLSGAVLTGAITLVVGKAVLGEPLTFSEAWSQLRPRLLPLVGLALLVLVVVAGVLVLGLVAGVALVAAGGAVAALAGVPLVLAGFGVAVWLYVRLSLAPCALVLERVGIGTSLRRSGVLVHRDWWRIFGILLLTFLIGGFVSQIVQLPFAVLGAGSPAALFDPNTDVLGTRSLVLSAIGAGIASTLVLPFTAGVRALLYVDRRMRAEGLDVSLVAASQSRSSALS
jgi:hypothetical protein